MEESQQFQHNSSIEIVAESASFSATGVNEISPIVAEASSQVPIDGINMIKNEKLVVENVNNSNQVVSYEEIKDVGKVKRVEGQEIF
jgi:hypothetical protein